MMKSMTVSTAALTSIVSGRLMCESFSEMAEAAEFLLGYPVWTHEFADKQTVERLEAAVLAQHPDMDIDLSEVTRDNVAEHKQRVIDQLGESREIVRGTGTREKGPVATLNDAFERVQTRPAQRESK